MKRYITRVWQKLTDGKRILMAELEVEAEKGIDAAMLTAIDLGLSKKDWDDGTASPPIVIRVETKKENKR